MSLLVAATFATPAFAKDAKTAAAKNRGEIKEVLKAAEVKTIVQNEEEKTRGANAYRLTEIQDPNEATASKSRKSVTVRPWTGSNRKRILTPVEYDREQREGKYSTYAGSEVGLHYDDVYGLKVKIPFGGAKQ